MTFPRRVRSARFITLLFAVVILVPSMLGFFGKFRELVAILGAEVDGAFAISPVVNYLLASLGFFFLLLGALVNGMFTDIEQPKLAMLETEERLNQQSPRT